MVKSYITDHTHLLQHFAVYKYNTIKHFVFIKINTMALFYGNAMMAHHNKMRRRLLNFRQFNASILCSNEYDHKLVSISFLIVIFAYDEVFPRIYVVYASTTNG